jgi:hypothetical protein
MKEDNATIISEVGPDLFVPPHVLPVLMELLGGDRQQSLSQREQLLAHLAICNYCRTAVVLVLNVAQKYDRRSNDSEEPTRDLLMRFANISREIEECGVQDYELMGAYAEAIIAEGREEADKRFHTLGEHIKRCRSCESALEDTLTFLNKLEETK